VPRLLSASGVGQVGDGDGARVCQPHAVNELLPDVQVQVPRVPRGCDGSEAARTTKGCGVSWQRDVSRDQLYAAYTRLVAAVWHYESERGFAATCNQPWRERKAYRKLEQTRYEVERSLDLNGWYEWEEARHKALSDSGACCAHCGSKDNLHADHIIPRCQHGPSIASNMQLLCRGCNLSKGGRTMEEWLSTESASRRKPAA
jgi:5-methylcytosine-specific restriction endonuclease McrA